MTDKEQQQAAKQFAQDWKEKGYEKGESQPFWLALLRDVYDVEKPEKAIRFESEVKLDNTSFIDGYIDATHVMIEQKGREKDLNKPTKQSDGSLLTPFQQAQRYSAALPYSQRPRWIVTCNFKEFQIWDMEHPQGDAEIVKLEDLEKEYYRLSFLVKTENIHIKKELELSIAAGEIVSKLYDALLKQYGDEPSEKMLKSLNILCVRLVFCFYAEDANLFATHTAFHDYLASFKPQNIRKALIELFHVLNINEATRKQEDPFMDETLAAFPYVNGGLFAEENIIISNFAGH